MVHSYSTSYLTVYAYRYYVLSKIKILYMYIILNYFVFHFERCTLIDICVLNIWLIINQVDIISCMHIWSFIDVHATVHTYIMHVTVVSRVFNTSERISNNSRTKQTGQWFSSSFLVWLLTNVLVRNRSSVTEIKNRKHNVRMND